MILSKWLALILLVAFWSQFGLICRFSGGRHGWQCAAEIGERSQYFGRRIAADAVTRDAFFGGGKDGGQRVATDHDRG